MGEYAQIVFGIPLKEAFDYAIPSALAGKVEIGKRVYVPFGKRKAVGYCVGKSKKSRSAYTKEIISVLDEEVLFTKKFLSFLKLVAEHYFASWGEMVELATPAYLRKPKKTTTSIDSLSDINKDNLFEQFSPEAGKIIDTIEKKGKLNFLLFEDYFQEKRINIYYELCAWTLRQGKDVLIIVPEISLVEDWHSLLKTRLSGYEFVFYHSGLKEKDGFINWWKIREKNPKLIIGTKMAVFHPHENIGLIIVEDEGSSFYKQDEFPFFNARDVAFYRSSYYKIPLILSGTPPSVETYYKVKKDMLELIDLRERLVSYPDISVVDLSMVRKKNYITKPLEMKINEVLQKGKKIFLFLNRRGFATFIRCRKCHKVMRCSRCERNFVYHFSTKKMVCHYCGAIKDPPQLCPECKASYLRYQGMGTEKMESELNRLFPRARIARIDLDVKREKMLKNIIKDLQENRIDILTGTSILLKLPPIFAFGLMGIINLEQESNFPDFRAGEKTFSLLIRLLRWLKEDIEWGTLLIQTHNPQNSLIDALRRLDYEAFYREEIILRKDLGLPPFKNLIVINLRGKNKKSVEKNASLLAETLKDINISSRIFISEAVPHPIFKLRDKYRWQIFIKSGSIKKVFNLLEEIFKNRRKFRGNILTVDIEPKGRG
ncbi:MAG: primosomal protein N' [Candidatus Omnitrophota bacterium]